jgi:hypothetical protein
MSFRRRVVSPHMSKERLMGMLEAFGLPLTRAEG